MEVNERDGSMARSNFISQFAATAGIVVVLAAAGPAMAANPSPTAGEPVVKAATSPIKHHAWPIKRHTWRATRIAASHHRRITPIRSTLDCSGVWCGRKFVLMIGIGY